MLDEVPHLILPYNDLINPNIYFEILVYLTTSQYNQNEPKKKSMDLFWKEKKKTNHHPFRWIKGKWLS